MVQTNSTTRKIRIHSDGCRKMITAQCAGRSPKGNCYLCQGFQRKVRSRRTLTDRKVYVRRYRKTPGVQHRGYSDISRIFRILKRYNASGVVKSYLEVEKQQRAGPERSIRYHVRSTTKQRAGPEISIRYHVRLTTICKYLKARSGLHKLEATSKVHLSSFLWSCMLASTFLRVVCMHYLRGVLTILIAGMPNMHTDDQRL